MAGRTKAAYRSTLHNETWLRKAYVEESRTTHEIGALLGCPASTVARALHRLGIPVRSEPQEVEERECPSCRTKFLVGGRGNRRRTQVYCSRRCHMLQQTPRWTGSDAPRPKKNVDTLHREEWLVEHYVTKRMGMGEIAVLCSCSVPAVYHALHKFGIPLRPLSEAAYGRKKGPVGRHTGDTSVERAARRDSVAYRALKKEMVDAYGGKCACCGETEIVFLCLDHPKGGGIADRTSRGGSAGLIRALQKAGWPKDNYRILCANCNLGTKLGQTCPHQLKKEAAVPPAANPTPGPKAVRTVAELIAVLLTMPPDAPVFGTWEGIAAGVNDVRLDDRGRVLIDVDQC